MSGVIFSAVDGSSVADAEIKTSKLHLRSDTPDSGQGGYFTQSETESRGSQSPETTQHIYKIENQRLDNRKTKSTLLSCQEVGRSRENVKNSTGRSLTSNNAHSRDNISKVGSISNNNRSKISTRQPRTSSLSSSPRTSSTAPRTSSSLPPPVPKKQKTTQVDQNKRSTSLNKRTVAPPERKPGRTLPLQIQSPSIVQALRSAGANVSGPVIKQSRTNVKQSSSQGSGAAAAINHRSVSSVSSNKSLRNVERKQAAPEKPAVKIPTKFVSSGARDASHSHQTKPIIKEIKVTRSNSSQAGVKPPETCKPKSRIASESLASRAKRSTADKVKKIYNNIKSPKQERKLNYSDRRKNLTREKMIVPASRNNQSESDFPVQPVQSLIKLYDKSKVKLSSTNKQEQLRSSSGTTINHLHQKLIQSDNTNYLNVVNNNQQDVGIKSGNKSSVSTPQRNPSRLQTSRTGASVTKPNSIDEFLQSARKHSQKYQDMLKGDEYKVTPTTTTAAVDNIHITAEPTENDLVTGCFTDVSFAGYFAKPSEINQNKTDASIRDNTDNLDQDQNKLCGQPSKYREEEAATDENHVEREKSDHQPPTQLHQPTPSPRLKKKQRREQILQEHKQLGKMVLASCLAKSQFEQHQESNNKVSFNYFKRF